MLEALRNSIIHGSASKIEVTAVAGAQDTQLTIRDNGTGFAVQPEVAALGGHWGILGMRERAEKLGGRIDITSTPGDGTRIEVTIPV